MKATKRLGLMLLAAGLCLAQEHRPAAAAGQKVELQGTIEKIQLQPGQGMPSMDLKTGKGLQRVMLGSMRYLMEKNFSPKAGEPAVVKGFQQNGEIVAQSVTLPSSNVTLQLRDDSGMPLWRGGANGRRRGQGGPPKL